MNKLFVLLNILFLAFSISAQSKIACETDRYEKDLFSEFDKKTVEYATAKGWKDEQVSLLTDIYEPKSDSATLKPLIIFAHGGSFVTGNKEQVAPFCTKFVKKGYVTASIQYRLLPLDKVRQPDTILRELVRATNDMRAAIRYFRQNAATYKIDPDNIFIGGVSAGAITALQVGLLDEDDKVSEIMSKIIAEEGGLNGDTGSAENRKFSSKVKGIFNLSGAVFDVNWIDKSDAKIFSYHGTDDQTVYINYRKIGELELFGSESITQKADQVGLENLLLKVPSGGHVDVYFQKYTTFFDDFQKQSNQKIRSMLCGANSQKN